MAKIIPHHVRQNYERTDDQLHEIKGLIYAFDFLHDAFREAEINSNEELAKDTVLRALVESVKKIGKLRQMEWAGHGGEPYLLDTDEIAVARGEATKVKAA